jgi:hypothetical protein
MFHRSLGMSTAIALDYEPGNWVCLPCWSRLLEQKWLTLTTIDECSVPVEFFGPGTLWLGPHGVILHPGDITTISRQPRCPRALAAC